MNPHCTPHKHLGPVGVLLTGLALSACSTLGSLGPAPLEDSVALARLEVGERALAEGHLMTAIERLAALRLVPALGPDVRSRTESLLQEAVQRRFQQLESAQAGPGKYDELFTLELPPRLRARAGLLAASELFEEGRRVAAYRKVQEVERKVPHHADRAFAAEVLARTGLDLIEDPRRYYLLFNYRSRGIQALEYLVLTYPLSPHCDQAYDALARVYDQKGDEEYAIARTEDLLVYHPESPYAVTAEARLPYLRLRRLGRDDYDRSQLLLAHDEIQGWLQRHAGHELEPWVRELAVDCQGRLAESDLRLARYYGTVGSEEGVRLHASRALRTAEDAGLQSDVAEAQALLGDSRPRPASAEVGPAPVGGAPLRSSPEGDRR